MDYIPADPFVPVGLQVGLRFSWWAPVSLIDGTVATGLSDMSPALDLTGVNLVPGGEASQDWEAKWQYSLEYDGVNDYMGTSDEADLRLPTSTDVTFSAWVKFTGAVSAGGVYPIVSKMTGASSGEFLFYLFGATSGTLRAGIRVIEPSGRFVQYLTTGVVPWNTWVLVSFVRSVNGVTLPYFNAGGTSSGSVSSGTYSTAGDFEIGACTAMARFFPGKIDQVTRWNRTLTLEERQMVATTDLWDGVLPVSRAASGDPLNYPIAQTDLPSAPTDLEAVADGSNEVDLAWFNSALGIGMVEVFRSLDGGASTVLTRLSNTEASYHDSGADTSVSTYAYKVKATNQNGESAFTAEVTVGPAGAGVTTDEGTVTTDDGTLTTDES